MGRCNVIVTNNSVVITIVIIVMIGGHCGRGNGTKACSLGGGDGAVLASGGSVFLAGRISIAEVQDSSSDSNNSSDDSSNNNNSSNNKDEDFWY